MGEAWHNNHHAYPASANMGLRRGQIDPGFRFIQLLQALGLAWAIQTPDELPDRPSLLLVDTVTPGDQRMSAPDPSPVVQPLAWRLVVGLILAPLVPSALAAPTFLGAGAGPGAFAGMTLLVLLIGAGPGMLFCALPAYGLLIGRVRPRVWVVVLAGGVVGAGPWIVLGLLWSLVELPSDGAGALLGWIAFSGWALGLGAVGGLVFWLCIVWLDRPFQTGTPRPQRNQGAIGSRASICS